MVMRKHPELYRAELMDQDHEEVLVFLLRQDGLEAYSNLLGTTFLTGSPFEQAVIVPFDGYRRDRKIILQSRWYHIPEII